ncbi:twin-arginine translocase subunit TatB [Zoogloea oleivorans]|jgi:sec-independent protein translocase protein TatB|uniref:Sec-independent protein translocase protein TatB n=1 Tax=Zoogloea oleivorans TaxID=1552750 RepID=A0A6C2CK82_9RHOO|nr:Sec-independent protein translocase protein TatB [Zoogloea oleivorans]TYC54680.1 twin-arginine translocase subunit TatB [Zoogloea oleivorans]
MFDIGFSELMVIGIVALLVLGPERLPKVARTTGHLLGRLQRYVSDVKSDINREMQLDELKKLQEEARKSAMEFESTVRNEAAGIENGMSSSLQSASSAVAELENSMKSSISGEATVTAPVDLDAAAVQLDRQLEAAAAHVTPNPEAGPTSDETVLASGKAKS